MEANIAQIFVNCGSSQAEAEVAAKLADRFEDLRKATGQDAIKNLFFFLRDQVFKDTLNNKTRFVRRATWASETTESRANRLMAAVCVELEIFSLEPVNETRGDVEVTTLEIDINELLGIDLDALMFDQTVQNVMDMVRGPEAKLAKNHDLNICTVTWEDSSRFAGSCWGNNISDLTLGVELSDGKVKELPVVRTSNYSDRSADLDPANFNIMIGNAQGNDLEQITLKEALQEPWRLLHDPDEWPLKDDDGNNQGLWLDGIDEKVLVSAQACFMPVSKKGGEATYKPHIYNYQSWNDSKKGPRPAVLTMMVTRNGTTIDVCGKKLKTSGRGQPLWFNDDGERAPLVAKRPTVVERLEMDEHKAEGRTAQDNAEQHNRVLIVQVPLKSPPREERWRGAYKSANLDYDYGNDLYSKGAVLCSSSGLESAFISDVHDGAAVTDALFLNSPKKLASRSVLRRARGTSDVEDAVVHTGEAEGAFDENLGQDWKRDTGSPVRITVQLTKATSNGVVTESQMEQISSELEDVYNGASRLGSLVVSD